MLSKFKYKEFYFEERKAIIYYPSCEPNGRMLLKTEYLCAFPNFDAAMLDRGYHLIHIFKESCWAPDYETERMARFVKYCANELNASERCVVEGMSCGGLQGAKLAELHPELVAVLYLDAAVLNILSMAGLGEIKCDEADMVYMWRELVAAYGVNRSTIINFRKSPIDNMAPLIENNIPVIMLYGAADNTVVYEENGKVLEDYYKEHGGTIKVIAKSMCKHHPHGLDNPAPIIEFCEKHYK
ncbi:MAG: alpha/beta hydrolase [Ruminococcaceae bacterium]|nr:alpha/beta hydrolase [Oscillospiraceae bacterium]